MAAPRIELLSVVIPCYNEASNIAPMYGQLVKVLDQLETVESYEIVYVNDGSSDKTHLELQKLRQNNKVRIISFSRNFGKEIAITAGIQYSKGGVVIMLDADGQHPVELIPEFIAAWQAGNQVVIGVRRSNQKEGLTKRFGSKIFYKLINSFGHNALVPGSTDYRLIDAKVRNEFLKLPERNRITRGLIDWLGFRRTYVYFNANERLSGKASYNIPKLIELAINSFVSLSLKPLYISLFIGMVILPLSIVLGVFSGLEMLVGDPFDLHIHGTAFIAILILFSIGMLLISQGFIAVYLSHMYVEAQNRPLFVVDKENSHGISL